MQKRETDKEESLVENEHREKTYVEKMEERGLLRRMVKK